MPTANEIILALNLEPLDGEGGYFRQTWILSSTSGAPQATAIVYLVTPESFSSLHRLDADEVFHFYLGDACEQIVIGTDDEMETRILGSDVIAGQHIQTIVPKGTWQGTKLMPGGKWALLGTTMTPGFHTAGFELATRDDLKSLSIETATIATEYLADGA